MKIADIKTIEDVQKFRKEVLRPMEAGEDKRNLRQELQAKAREIRKAEREKAAQ